MSQLFVSHLTDNNPLLLVEDLQVFFHLLGIQVLDCNGLHLKRVGLEILKIASKENRVCRINFLNTIL